jgi:hypothetical protein
LLFTSSASGFGEGGLPAGAVGEDVQECLAGWHVVAVAGADAIPGVPGWVVCRKVEGGQQPGFAVGAVVGEGLAGPLAGDQDAAARVAQVLAAVGLDGDEQSSSRRGPDTAQSYAGAPSRPPGSSLSGGDAARPLRISSARGCPLRRTAAAVAPSR